MSIATSNSNVIESAAWFYKYQPKTFDDYIFSTDDQKTIVEKWVKQNQIDGNLLLFGSAGMGKTALAELLINHLIKHQYDVKKITSRSVKDIDQLYSWCQTVAIKSKKKIVYIEEFDKLSSTAMTTMKDSLLENFQTNVSFICNTNNIHAIDKALVTRFNYKFNLVPNKTQYLGRLLYILKSESIHYQENDIIEFVANNYTNGLRELISKAENSSLTGVFNFDPSFGQSIEEELVESVLEMYKTILNSQNNSQRKMVMLNPIGSVISKQYEFIIETGRTNPDIIWTDIYTKLEANVSYLPIKFLIAKRLENIDNKKFPHLDFLAFLYESFGAIMELH
jgi:replication-associated recombination protein RarA